MTLQGARRRHPDGARRLPAAAVHAEVLREAVDRTASWAERARTAFRAPASADARSARGSTRPSSASCRAAPTRRCGPRAPTQTAALGFDGYGDRRAVGRRVPRRDAAGAGGGHRRACRPTSLRYLMGVGDPAGMVEAVALGVDMFDCVLPTRLAGHGTVLDRRGSPSPAQRPLHLRRGPARRPLRVSDVRPLVAGLPPAPAAGRRAHRPSTDHRAQPLVDPGFRAPDAQGHRVRHLRFIPFRHPGGLGLSRSVLPVNVVSASPCRKRNRAGSFSL